MNPFEDKKCAEGPTSAREQHRFSFWKYFGTSVVAGLLSLREPGMLRPALARIVNPLSFPRPEEFRQVLHDLAPELTDLKGGRILDVGSPKLPVLIWARDYPEIELYATDILPSFIPSTTGLLRAMGLESRLGDTVHLQTEDVRSLSFPDETFDWAYSISVLEHVADEDGQAGDARAISEIARVLKPGGTVTLTVPYDPGGYREEYVQGAVYERGATPAALTFYQRHYDESTLDERLIKPSGLRLDAKVLLGEAGILQVEPWWNRIPMKFKLPFLPLQGIAGMFLFRALPPDKSFRASGVAIRLVKQGAPDAEIGLSRSGPVGTSI
jgi:SAM-dependent methyltransferase